MPVIDHWMTEFYGKKWILINSAKEMIEQNNSVLYEWRINASDHENFKKASDLGFELVETAVEFETQIYSDTSELPKFIREANSGDLDAILRLVDICFVKNPDFYNRIKNSRYFSSIQTADYFRKSIINNFGKSQVLTTVAVKENWVFGFYIMKKLGSGKYKVVSTAVHPDMRGRKVHILLQRKFTDLLQKPYFLINRTQLGNYAVLNNHIKEQRKLSTIEYIMYLNK